MPSPADVRFQQNRIDLRGRTVLREHLTEILLMPPSCATMMLTYYGLSVTMGETGATFVQKGQALAVALSIGVFAWLGWFYLFGLIYRLRGTRLAVALSAASLYVGTLAAIDAPFNMMAIAGGTAVQMSLDDVTASAERRKDEIFANSLAAQRLLPAIRAQAQRFAALQQSEIDHGTQSGRPKPGKVSDALGQVAGLLNSLADDIGKGVEASRALQGELGRHFAELKAQTYRPGPIRPRVEAAVVAAERIDDLLVQMAQHDYGVSIAATLKSLATLFPASTQAGTGFQQVQNDEVRAISEMVKPVAEALQAGLSSLATVKSEPATRKRPQGPHEAVRTYWRALLPEWAAALFIDLAPAILLIILISAWREHDHQPAGHAASQAAGTSRAGDAEQGSPSARRA